MSAPAPEYPVLDDAHYVPLLVLGALSSILSILGSSCIMYMASREGNLKNRIQHRLLFALSLADWITSFSCLIMPYLIPSWVGFPGAIGNNASCTAVGFFFLLASKMGCCYNAYLSIYYCLMVTRNWREHDFSNRPLLEGSGHVIAIIVSIVIETVAAATQSINPTPFINNQCLYAATPWGCLGLDDVDCQRSSQELQHIVIGASGPTYFIFSIAGFICTGIVFFKVRRTLKRSSQYRFENSVAISTRVEETAPRTSVLPRTNSTTDNDDPNNSRIQQVRTQAVLYSLAYFQSFFWPFFILIMTSRYSDAELSVKKLEPGFYALTVLYWTCYPLQGAFNFFVYTRLKAKAWRQVEPDKPIFWIYQQVITSKPPQVTRISSRASKSKHVVAESQNNGNNNNNGDSKGRIETVEPADDAS